MNVNLGKAKMWAERLRGYLMWTQFAIVVYVFIKEGAAGIPLEVFFPVLIIGSIILVAIDTKFIMPKEYSYVFEKTPPLQELKEESFRRLDCIACALQPRVGTRHSIIE
ncbi:MAG: hypothetical protein JW834_01275 [Candidatus Diapherotrites archaeon]|nr:hypothetical protein [Candidatus Diapherotrites archaeon]